MFAIEDLMAFIASHSRKGDKCGECSFIFTADRGDGKNSSNLPQRLGRGFLLCPVQHLWD